MAVRKVMLHLRYLSPNKFTRQLSSDNDHFDFQSQMSEANTEMASLFGPLGDPDYDSDSSTPPKTKPLSSKQSFEDPLKVFSDQMKAAQNTRLAPPSAIENVDDPIQRIVNEHHKRLIVNVQELLDDHYVGLCAELRTELRKQKLRNRTPFE